MPTPPPKVFVSSTWLDLQPERKAVEAAIRRMNDPGFVGMEYFGSENETPREIALEAVDHSDVYIGVFAARYGSGITEDEYRQARKSELPCFIYFKSKTSITFDQVEMDAVQQKQLEELKAELRREHTISEFSNPDELATKVIADLYRWVVKKYLPHAAADETSAAMLAALHELPLPPPDFTGRTEELEELTRAIEQGGATISGLQGLGGIGKTTLALKLAELLAPRYPDAQFYLDLKGTTQPLTPSDAMAHVIRAYHLTEKLPDNENELSVLYRFVLQNKRALLLMDNAANAAQVSPLIPPEGCTLLITSRTHFTLPGLFAKDINTLPPDDARTLLLTIAPRIGKHADEIAMLCGYLPLALRLAASIIVERKNLKPENYARRLTDATQRLELVEASLKLSYDLLSAKLQRLWRTLGVFPATFDAQAAAAVWQIKQDAADDALGELIKYSLLNWDDATDRYSLHDLARLSASHHLSDEERHVTELRHSEHYLAVLNDAHSLYLQGGDALMRGLALFDAERTNIQAGQAWASQHADEETAARLCSFYPLAGAYILTLRLHPREQINWLEQALLAARKTKDRYTEANALGNLGLAYAALGQTGRAIEFYEQDLAIRKRIGDRLGEGKVLGNLGLAYADLGEPRRAIKLHEQALEIDREIGDRRGEGADLGNLGNAYAALGQTHRAIEFYEQRLIIAKEIGDWHGEGSALGNLGLAYAVLGQPRRAIELYERQLAIAREIGDRPGEGAAQFNMSRAVDKIGERERAIELAEAALRIAEEIEDPHAAMVREQLDEWRGQTK